MAVNDPRPALAAKTGREPPEASSPALAGEAGWGPAFAPAEAAGEARRRSALAERPSPNPSRQAGGERNGTPPNTTGFRAWRERQRRREEREKEEAAARLHDIA